MELKLFESSFFEKEIRIITFNVHGWNSEHGEDNLEKIIELFQKLKPHIIFLQEVIHWQQGKSSLIRLSESLKMEYICELAAVGLSNAILSMFPMIEKWSRHLRVGQAERRVLVGARLKIGTKTLPVFATHLDSLNEEIRISQLQIITNFIEQTLQTDEPHILGGDFNSLNFLDYSEESWNVLKQKRRFWEPPRIEVLLELLNNQKYIDPFAYIYNQNNPNNENSNKQSPKNYPEPTSWAGTRIDYILFSYNFSGKILSYETVQTNASDHQPVLVSFQL